jgi:predicted dehydrogenase
MKRLRTGIIGTGAACRLLHLPALTQLQDRYAISALANRSPDKAIKLASEIGLSRELVFGDYKELLKLKDLDLVIIAVPPDQNRRIAEDAMKAGKDVICEKPLASTLEDAERMVSFSDTYGKSLLLAENLRYDRRIIRIRELIDSGTVDPPFLMTWRWIQKVPVDDPIAARPWRGSSGLPGGAFTDHGIHMIDGVRFLLGELEHVSGFGKSVVDHVSGEDTALWQARCSSGALCSVQWTFAADEDEHFGISLWSRNGRIRVDGALVESCRGDKVERWDGSSEENSFYHEFLDFHHVLTGGGEPLIGLEDGVRDLEAAYRIHASFTQK